MQPQHLGGVPLAIHAPPAAFQHHADVVAVNLVEGLVR